MKQEQLQKLQEYAEDFYKNLDGVRLDKWNYDDGCLLMAAIALYEASGKEFYKDFVVSYMDHYVTSEGQILHYKLEDYNLDNIAPGRALLFAYEKTGEERFMKAALLLKEQLAGQPRTGEGSYWHKKIYPNQVWLDGLYMAQPFRMALDTRYGKKDQYNDICDQLLLVRKRMFDEKAGLFYHGYDESRSIFWADRESGCSANFWLRSIGWYLMALVDTMEEMDRSLYDYLQPLMQVYKDGLCGLLRYQDKETSLFYQVVNKKEVPGNYLETSGSAMTAASIFKACRLKAVLTEKYGWIGDAILSSLTDNRLLRQDDGYVLKGTCKVAGLGPKEGRRDGSVAYYLSEPVEDNDRKGMAALFMAYAQYLKLSAL